MRDPHAIGEGVLGGQGWFLEEGMIHLERKGRQEKERCSPDEGKSPVLTQEDISDTGVLRRAPTGSHLILRELLFPTPHSVRSHW